MRDRAHDRLVRAAQLRKKLTGISRIGAGIERLLQTVESLRVLHQVYLHAAHVDIPHALGLQLPDGDDRLFLGWVKPALSAGRVRPGPSKF